MSNNQPRFVHEYKEVWQDHIDRTHNSIVNGYWHHKEYRQKFSQKEEDFKHTQTATEDLLEALGIFVHMAEGERNRPGVQPIITSMMKSINIHLDRITKYYAKNKPEGFKTKEAQRDESKLQRIIFKGRRKILDEIKSFNIENDMSNFDIEFHSKKVASLVFKECLEEFSDDIKGKIKNLDVDWDYIGDKRFFINIPKSEKPNWNSSKHFWDQDITTLQFYIGEYNKIKKGFYLGNYFVHPWLYFHINYFKTNIPTLNSRGVIEEKVRNVDFRRTEWYFAEILKKVEDLSRGGVFIYGSRRIGKSVLESSKLAHKSLISSDAELAVTINNDEDRLSLTDKIQTCYAHLPSFLRIETNKDDWEKIVEVGLKTKANKKIKHCNIRITNLAGGSKKASQKGAGGAPVEYIFDEALKWNTKVYLEDGTKLIKEVEVGDKIYGADGHLTEVLEKKEFLNEQLYEIEFNDGRKIKASGNHLWSVKDRHDGKIKEKTTLEMIDTHTSYQIDSRYPGKKYKKRRYSIPINKTFNYKEKELKIEPYYLGLFLGDGSKGTGSITSCDDEIRDYIFEYADKLNMGTTTTPHHRSPITFNYLIKTKQGTKNKIREWLREYNTFDEKNIPHDYLYSSKEQRLELLRGYMDSDGYVGKKGNLEICITEDRLADQFLNLLGSLGIRRYHRVKETAFTYKGEYKKGQDTNRISFTTKLSVFKLTRKKKRQKFTGNKKFDFNNTRVSIENITKVEKADAYCISVDNKDKLFVAGEHIVTHNCGKANFIDAYNAAKYSFKTPLGWKTIPIFVGTGTNVDISQDAEKVLMDPEKYDFIGIDWDILEYKVPKEHITWNRRKFGWFVPAQISYEEGLKFKEMTFGDFLDVDDPILNNIKFIDADWEHNSNMLLTKQKELMRHDRKEYQSYCVFLPTDPEHCFMSAKNNPYRPQLIKKRRVRLQSEGDAAIGLGRKIRLHRDQSDFNKIRMELSTEATSEFPHKGGFLDAPGILYGDFPNIKPHDPYRYVAGLDDYKFESSDGDSIGSFMIYDRLLGRIVYELTTRPDPHIDFHKEMRMALDAWNAMCFMEAFDMDFKKYLDRVATASLYLYKTFDADADFSYLSSGRRGFGWVPNKTSTPKVRGFSVDFCKEDTDVFDKDDNIIDSVRGFERIDSVQLLIEMERYKEGGNFDRLIAFSSCLAIDHYLTSKYLTPTKPHPKNMSQETQESHNPFVKNKYFTKSRRSKFTRR